MPTVFLSGEDMGCAGSLRAAFFYPHLPGSEQATAAAVAANEANGAGKEKWQGATRCRFECPLESVFGILKP